MIILEIIAFITTLLCVYLTVNEKILAWPLSIISSLLFLVIFYNSNLYGESFLQIIFIIQSIQGWINWGNKKEVLKISYLNKYTFIFECMLMLLMSYLLSSDIVRFFDILTAVVSLYATYYLTKKFIQTWILWIIVDLILVVLLSYKGLYISASLYLVLLIMATTGLITWYKTLKSYNNEEV